MRLSLTIIYYQPSSIVQFNNLWHRVRIVPARAVFAYDYTQLYIVIYRLLAASNDHSSSVFPRVEGEDLDNRFA